LVVPPLVALLAFAWALGLGPLSDDFVLRTWAATGDWTPEAWPYVRPVPLALWGAIIGAGGEWTALHLINVLLHAVNSALVATMAVRWLGPWSGLVAGTLFALFPASTEAVAWTAGVFDVLATTCVLLATLAWTSPRWSFRSTALLAVACALGPLAKETAVVIPALLVAAATIERRPWTFLRERTLALSIAFGLSVSLIALRLIASPALAAHAANVPSSRYAWKELIVRPVAGLAVPFRTDMGIGGDVFVSAFALLSLLAVAMVRLRTRTTPAAAVVAFGLGWILIAAAPLLLDFYVSPALEERSRPGKPDGVLGRVDQEGDCEAEHPVRGRHHLDAGLAADALVVLVVIDQLAWIVGDRRLPLGHRKDSPRKRHPDAACCARLLASSTSALRGALAFECRWPSQ
jgi:hypothetical protein